jgi:hypothetical protein
VNIELSEAQQTRGASICNMCYEGNRLLSDWERKKESKINAADKRVKQCNDSQVMQIGKRVSFSKP